MTDLRKFCIGFCLGAGAMAILTALTRASMFLPIADLARMFFVSFCAGAVAVAFFGNKKPSEALS